jgi:hypothetical protein
MNEAIERYEGLIRNNPTMHRLSDVVSLYRQQATELQTRQLPRK